MTDCSICGKDMCYARRHEKRCQCGIFDLFQTIERDFAIFQCPKCRKERKVQLMI